MRTGLTLAGTLLLSLALGGAALAAPTPKRAEELFRQGRQWMARGDFVHACKAFADSNALDPATGTLLNLALCHEQLGDDRSALDEFRAAAANADRRQEKDRATFARQRAAEIEKKLTQRGPVEPAPALPSTLAPFPEDVTPTVPSPSSAATAGASATPAPPPAPSVAPAPRTAPSAPDRQAVPSASGSPSPEGDGAGSGTALRALGWSAAAAGVVSVGVASYFGLHASSQNHWDTSPNCQTQVGVLYCNGTALGERSQALQSAGISTALFVVGGVLVAGGTTLALLAPKGHLRVAPAVGRGGAGLAAAGSFE